MCWPSRSAIRRRSSSALVKQVTGTVRWRECVEYMAGAGVTTFYEVGAGKVLSGLVKRLAGVSELDCDRHAGRHRRLQGRARLKGQTMFDLNGKTALVTGATGGIGGAIARALHKQGATVAISGTRKEALEQLAAIARRARARSACEPRRQGRGRGACAGGRSRRWRSSISLSPMPASPRTICSFSCGRGVGRGHRRQSDRDLPAGARGDQGHDAPPLRADHRHHVGGRRHRQSGAGQLHRGQSRHDRHDEDRSAPNMPSAALPPIASRRASSRRR